MGKSITYDKRMLMNKFVNGGNKQPLFTHNLPIIYIEI